MRDIKLGLSYATQAALFVREDPDDQTPRPELLLDQARKLRALVATLEAPGTG